MANTDVRNAIEAAIQQFTAAFIAGRAADIAALYADGARLMPPNSDFVEGRSAIEQFWQGAMNLGLKNAELKALEVEAHGDTAIEVGEYRLLAAGNVQADAGKYIVVWKQQAGAWKLYRDIWNSSQPAAAPAGA